MSRILAADLPPLALIPARGGSKGIPGKNLRCVGGVPLIARTIRAARAARSLNRVVVSTDDLAIRAQAESEGAEVVARPIALAGDQASSESALVHALEQLARESALPGVVVFLQCTSPFTTAEQIDLVVERLQQSEANVAFSVAAWHGFLWQLDEQGWGKGVNHDPSQPRVRRQALPPTYLESGAIYALRTLPFLERPQRFLPPLLPVPVSAPALEIDTELDLLLCDRWAAAIEPAHKDIHP